MKKIIIAVAGLLALLVGAVFVLPGFIDWNSYRDDIAAAVRDATGRKVAIEGDLSLSLIPRTALSVQGVKIGNPDGASTANMLELERLDVIIRLVPLLSGRIEVDSVRLIRPVLVLEKMADGSANWVFEPQAAASGPKSSAAGTDESGASSGMQLSLDRFEISQGKVVYRDAQSGIEESVEELELTGSASSMLGPFEIAGRVRARGVAMSFELSLGRLEKTRPATLKLTVRGEQELFTAAYQGRIDDPLGTPQLSGDLTVAIKDLAAAAATGGVRLPPFLAQKLELKTRLRASAAELSLNDLRLALGDINAGGALNVALAESPSFDIALDIKRLDLDKLLRAADQSRGGKEGTAAKADEAGEKPAGAAAPLSIPLGVKGSVSLNIDGISFKGGLIRQFNLQAAIDNGKVELSRLAAQLPGGSDFSLSGKAENSTEGPRFAGSVDILADNLRGLLAWAGFDASALAGGRLASLRASARLTATRELIQISDADIRLDNTNATVAAAIRLQARPSFGLTVNIDKLNLDGYAALARSGTGANANAAGAKSSAQRAEAKPAAPLAVLNDFDANVNLSAGQLSYGKIRARGLSLAASLVGGKLSISQFKVADLAGASLALTGSADGFAATPTVDITLQGAAKNMIGLARLAGIEMPIPPARLRQAKLAVRLIGNTDRASIKAEASAAGATVNLDGTVLALLEQPSAELKYRLRHASLAQLAKLLGVELEPIEGYDSAVDLAGTFKGGGAAFALGLAGSLAASRLTAEGEIRPGADPVGLDLAFNLEAKDAIKSLRSIGIDYRPAAGAVGGLKLAGKLKGNSDLATISDLTIVAGPLDIRGQGTLRLGGERPMIQAKLSGGDILLDPLLPGGGAAAGPGGDSGVQGRGRKNKRSRWSRERIDLSGLKSVDADLDISAKSIVFQRYPFIAPRLRLVLRNGILKIEELSGRLFKGQVALTATLDGNRTPKLDLAVKLTDADIYEALKTALQLDQVSGRMSFEGSFKTAGGSEWELVNGLNGNAAMSVRDGAIKGFDMKSFSARLANLNRAADFINLVNRTFAGGQTRLHKASGTWQVTRGVAKTKDTRAQLDASDASLTGTINLPAWRMDLRAVLRLIEHQNAPNVGAHIWGPLDAPKRDLKTRKLERWLVARAGKELLLKTLGKEKAGAAGAILDAFTGSKSGQSGSADSGGIIRRRQTQQQTVPQRQPQGSTTEDAVGGILRKLFNK